MNFNDVLIELYEIGSLPLAEEKEYRLIERYENKVSQRLLQRKKDLREKGKTLCAELMRKLVYTQNPFLAMSKPYSWAGVYYPVPIPRKD